MPDMDNGRTHEPNLREVVADLDGIKDLISEQIRAVRVLMDERDRRYTERFDSQEKAVVAALASAEKAVSTALSAAEKLVNAAFAASEKAIAKAETAQSDYNVRSNEFRGQLADQAKSLMPRIETENTFKQHRELIDRLRDESRMEIASLRESRSEGSGRHSQQSEGRAGNQWIISAGIAFAGLILAIVLGSSVFRQPAPAPPPIIIQAPPAPNAIGGGTVTDSRSTTTPKP